MIVLNFLKLVKKQKMIFFALWNLKGLKGFYKKVFWPVCMVLCVHVSFSFGLPVQSQNLMVAGPSPYMVQTVREISRKGGNLMDAAVAAAFSLSVTHPYFVSLACGGFAVLKLEGTGVKALDFREVAPRALKEDFYVSSGFSPRKGGAAVAVPGFVAGLWQLHQKYGTLPWKDLIQPALHAAQKGFEVSGDFTNRSFKARDKLTSEGLRIFFSPGKDRLDKTLPLNAGKLLKQKKLAKALKYIQKKGRDGFYKGRVAEDVVRAVKNHQGLLSLEDLKNYRVRWLKPLSFSYGDYTLYSMPLPSSGGVILSRALKLISLQARHLKPSSFYTLDEWHLLAEVLSLAFRPRSQMGDLSLSQKEVYEKWLWNRSFLLAGKKISLNRVLKLSPLAAKKTPPSLRESPETTHFSLMNNKGEALAMTLTLNGDWGSGVVSEKYGIVLNNQMDDFNTLPGKANQFGLIQGSLNNVVGGKRPLSSMSPVLVEKQGRVVLALGGSGGPRIISSVLQVLYRHLIQGWDVDQAIQAPRVHHQFLPRILFVEEKRFSSEWIKGLLRRGHTVVKKPSLGKTYGVSTSQKEGLKGAYDHRGYGAAGGL